MTTFPKTLGDHPFENARDFADAVIADSHEGGGTLHQDLSTLQWLWARVEEGELETQDLIGLTAGLFTAGAPGPLALAARLSMNLETPTMEEMLTLALQVHKTELLMRPDPFQDAGMAVEDTLLAAWVKHTDGTRANVRTDMLRRLRHAGLTRLELDVILRHGSPDERRQWLPAIATEILGEVTGTAFGAASDDEQQSIIEAIQATLAQ